MVNRLIVMICATSMLGAPSLLAQLAPVRMSPKLTIQVPTKTRELLQNVNDNPVPVDANGIPYQATTHTWTASSIDPSAVAVSPSSGARYIMYSNRPESIQDDGTGSLPQAHCYKSQCLADAPNSRVFLVKPVAGLGQIFSWHANLTSSDLYHGIVIRNTNSFAIHAASNHWATIDSDQTPNGTAWLAYAKSRRQDWILQPGQQVVLFRHSAPAHGGAFGLVAEVEITLQSDLVTPATASLADLAWQSDAAAGLPDVHDYSQAAVVASDGWERGVGNRYETYLTLNGVGADITAGPQVYKLGGLQCNGGGAGNDDGLGIPLDSPDGSSFVAALYGRSVTVRWPLVNRSAAKVHVRVAVGNSCVASGNIGFALRYPSGNVIAIRSLPTETNPGNYVDVMEADIGPGEVWDVRFQLFPTAPQILPVTVAAYVSN